MLERKVNNIGNSLYVTLPKDICKLYGIENGSILKFVIEDGKIVIKQWGG
jgi:antitoxin component of MazEF toxin-antitoxin module